MFPWKSCLFTTGWSVRPIHDETGRVSSRTRANFESDAHERSTEVLRGERRAGKRKEPSGIKETDGHVAFSARHARKYHTSLHARRITLRLSIEGDPRVALDRVGGARNAPLPEGQSGNLRGSHSCERNANDLPMHPLHHSSGGVIGVAPSPHHHMDTYAESKWNHVEKDIHRCS
jgi:hypothetical protein